MFDTTAPWSLNQLASGLHSLLTSPTDRWFDITVEDVDTVRLSKDELIWTEQVSDVLYGIPS